MFDVKLNLATFRWTVAFRNITLQEVRTSDKYSIGFNRIYIHVYIYLYPILITLVVTCCILIRTVWVIMKIKVMKSNAKIKLSYIFWRMSPTLHTCKCIYIYKSLKITTTTPFSDWFQPVTKWIQILQNEFGFVQKAFRFFRLSSAIYKML